MTLSLTISALRDLTPTIREFTLTGDALPSFTAGAHLDFDLGDLGTRSYSLISWSGDQAAPEAYVIAVQREEDGDGGSRKMHALKEGDAIAASAPKNDFPLAEGGALLIAGGIGVTPMISHAASAMLQGRPFQFHYAGRSRDVMAYRDEMQDAFGDALTLHFDDEAMIDLEAVIRDAPDSAQIHVCGPKGMIEAVRETAQAAGYARDRIHFELFTTSRSDSDESFEVEIRDTGDVYTIPPGKSIIEVLEEAGLDLVYDCQRGDCGICQTDVIEGEPDHRDVVLSDAEKAAGDVMQICVSRAKSARLVLDL